MKKHLLTLILSLSLLVSPSGFALIPEACLFKLAKLAAGQFDVLQHFSQLKPQQKTELKRILNEIREYPGKKFSPEDKIFLHQIGATNAVNKYNERMKQFGLAMKAYLFLGLGLIATETGISQLPETKASNADCAADTPSPSEIDLIFPFPLPHTYFRVGNTFYDFTSGGEIRSLTVEEFTTETAKASHLKSSTRIRIRVGEKEVEALKESMRAKIGTHYAYSTVNSCISKATGVIEDTCNITIPAGIDHNPFHTAAWLKLKQAFGSNQVSQVKFCSDEKSPELHPFSQLARTGAKVISPFAITDLAIIEQLQKPFRK